MNPAAILALIGDLYTQVSQLAQENAELRELVAAVQSEPAMNGSVPEPEMAQ